MKLMRSLAETALLLTASALAEPQAPGCVSGDCASGQGVFKFADGGQYSGQWENGKYQGVGEYTFANDDQYDGEWEAGMA
jgi:hypothetical protein